ncbi:topless-related protein 2-like isoform X2 [Camellia sinensis]|uniref:topless-related protein 2-like isoform X2 n=1 Tax=Camellia sinensis TaxID=4442 RepID=UPI001036657D|nr:topless-related protein 2-like isoform X2 [Camellia sinensis]
MIGTYTGSKCIRTTHRDKGTKVTYPTSRQHATGSLDDLPRTVACTMHQGSAVNSMDFLPCHHTLLLVGFATGEITLWQVGMRYKLVSKPFKIWDMANCYMLLQEAGCLFVVLKCVLALVVVVVTAVAVVVATATATTAAATATSARRILTIGIGTGTFCSGQVN